MISASEASDWWNGIKPLTFLFTAVPAFVWAAAGFSDSMITQGYGIINSATKPQVVTRILIISIEAMNIKCSCKVFTCVLWKVSPLNLHFVVSARMFSLEMSWRCCYTWLQAALPLCNLRVLRHEALTPAPWRLRSSQFMFLANIKQSPNIGFRILFSSGVLAESLTLSRKLKLEMLFPPDTSTHLLPQQLAEENSLKEKYPPFLKLFIDS